MGRASEDPYSYAYSVMCVAESDSGLALKMTPIDAPTTEPLWIPKSVIHDDSEVWKVGQEGKLVVKEWFAEKEGWD